MEFYETYHALIYAAARQKGLDHHEREDVVQEVVIAVARAMEAGRYEYRQDVTFKGYLRRIVRGCIAKQWEKRPREVLTNGGTPDVADPRTTAGDCDWEREWAQQAPRIALRRLELPAKHHRIFELYVIQEERAGKVAHNVGASVAQVYLVKHRYWKRYVAMLRRIGRDGQ